MHVTEPKRPYVKPMTLHSAAKELSHQRGVIRHGGLGQGPLPSEIGGEGSQHPLYVVGHDRSFGQRHDAPAPQ